MADQAAEIYDDMKARVKSLGLQLKDFSAFLGVADTSIPKWRSGQTPAYALNILQLLEAYHVRGAWKASKGKPAATQEDATAAMRPALTAVIDDAIGKGWSRAQIATVLRELADATDGTRSA